MSHLQPGISGGHLPVHAFYIPPQAAHVALATSSVAHRDVKQKLAFATPTATRPFRVIQTAAMIQPHVQHSRDYGSSSLVSASYSSSSMPSATIALLPPSINPPPYDSSFDNDKSASTSDNGNNVPWLAPLLGVLGAMGVILIAIIYLVRRRRYKSSPTTRSVVPNDPRYPKPITSNKHSSWASLSTINTSAGGAGNGSMSSGEDKTPIHMRQPPPAYSTTTTTTTKTPVQQKRLTADTLVDEPSLSMLKSQYSPQLAFSPSLVAGEFQQQQQQLDHPPLPNTATLSPSNTLIDNAGVLSNNNDKNQNYYSHHDAQQQQRIKIEMYDPQVNLHDAGMDDEDGFEAPYNKSYPDHQEEKVNAAAFEGDQHINAADATATTEHHQVINMSNTNKQ